MIESGTDQQEIFDRIMNGENVIQMLIDSQKECNDYKARYEALCHIIKQQGKENVNVK
jgi:hypothetical protein